MSADTPTRKQMIGDLIAHWRHEAIQAHHRGLTNPGVFKLRRIIEKTMVVTFGRCADELEALAAAFSLGDGPPAAPAAHAHLRTPTDLIDALGPWSVVCAHCQGRSLGGELLCRICAGYGRISVGPPVPAAPAGDWQPAKEKI